MILAIGHEAGTGKDTFSMFLVDWLRSRHIKNLNIVRQGFATNLYEICHLMYGWAGFKTRAFYDQHPAEKDKLLEAVGKRPWQILEDLSDKLTEYDREIFYNAVVKTTGPHLKIVPDLRRPLEFEKLKEDKAFLLRIAKTGHTSNRKFCQYLLPYHNQWDRTIYNDGTLSELREKAVAFGEEIVLPNIVKQLHGEI